MGLPVASTSNIKGFMVFIVAVALSNLVINRVQTWRAEQAA